MYSIAEYNNQAIKLAKSLNIKLVDAALAINKGLVNQYTNIEISTDKKTWKYFLNLSGQRHYINPDEVDETKKISTNVDVLITITELGTKQVLTKELLEKYPYTKNELLKQDELYENLLKEYPDEILYIHGCLFPCDIETSIAAKEGTILSYNTSLVETNETYLIPELQNFIQNFLTRYHIKEYTIIEDLYLSSMLATLYASLPTKINNLRLEKIFTNEVHSFHLEHFFRSHLDIWDELSVVNKKTKYWLYRNLPYLIRNLGKKATFQTIIDKILTPNDVGIGEYTLTRNNISLNTTAKLLEPSYNATELNLYSTPLNSYYTAEGNKDIGTVISKQLDEQLLAVEKEEDSYIVKTTKEKIKASQVDNQRTKIIEISTNEYYKKYGIDLFKFIFDYWVYCVKNDLLQLTIEFTDPNTNQPHMLNAKQGLLLLVKYLLALFNHLDLKLSTLNYDTVFEKNNSAIDQFQNVMFKDGYTQAFFTELKENFPNISNVINSVENFQITVNDAINYSTYLWIIDANSENSIVSANMKAMLNLITQKGSYNISNSGETIDELLDQEQCNINILGGYNISTSITSLILAFTGLKLNEYELIKNITDNYKSLLQKLTAYTTQIITQDSGEDVIHVYYNNTNIFRSKYGVINVNGAHFKPLDETYANLSIVSTNQEDSLITLIENLIGIRTNELKNAELFTGQVEIYSDGLYAWSTPQFQVEVVKDDVYTYDIELALKHYTGAAIKALDETYAKLTVTYKLDVNPIVDNSITFTTHELKPNEFIQGMVNVYNDNQTFTWLSPTFSVEAEKTTQYKVDAEDTLILK